MEAPKSGNGTAENRSAPILPKRSCAKSVALDFVKDRSKSNISTEISESENSTLAIA